MCSTTTETKCIICGSLTHLPLVPVTCQWTRSTLDQIMACCLFGAKPLSEPMLGYCQLDPREQNSVKFQSTYKNFHSWKCIWKYCLQNVSHFVQGGKELSLFTVKQLWLTLHSIPSLKDCLQTSIARNKKLAEYTTNKTHFHLIQRHIPSTQTRCSERTTPLNTKISEWTTGWKLQQFHINPLLSQIIAMHCGPRASPLCIQHYVQLASLSFQVNQPSHS